MLYFPLLFIACKNSNMPPPNTDLSASLEFKIQATLGEGPVWNHQTQELLWVDIEGLKVHVYTPATQKNRTFPTPSKVGTIVPMEDSLAVIALEDGIYTINTHTGEIQLFKSLEADIPTNRFNDGKCDPMGRLWVGSMHLPQTEANGKLYSIDAQKNVKQRLENITISNGIVWTKDHKTMYYIDTPTGVIRAFDYEAETGNISNERVAVKVPETLGFPDGMAIDENDQLWVGLWNGDAVAHFDPIAGELIKKIEVPAHNVTACAFGGPNLDTLYITTAHVDMNPEETAKYPDAGSIFKVVPGVKGIPSAHFGQSF